MGLHHFTWAGKERTVSITRETTGGITLTFIDEEIVRKGFTKIALHTKEPVPEVLHGASPASREVLEDLLAALGEQLEFLGHYIRR